MRITICLVALILMISGCSSTNEEPVDNTIVVINKNQQVQEIPFESRLGQAMLVFEGSGVDCIILVRGLKPKGTYTISLVGDNGDSPGVRFGPKENLKLRVGTLTDETNFTPNSEGEIFVSMRMPITILEGSKEMFFQINSTRDKEIMRTTSFAVQKR